jgi:TonB family protein
MSISPTLRGTAPAPERRAAPRRNVMDRRLVTVNLDNKDAGLMVDISEAGMAVQALARIKQGAATSMQFELPDTVTRIEATGTVAWVDTTSGRAGIRFENLPEASATLLKEWLDRRAVQDRPTTPAPVAGAPSTVLGPQSKVAEIAALQREIASKGLDRDAALALMVARARSLTRADGVAIVVGDSTGMTCRASSGSAPPVGADLRPESGLSGECVRTGVTVRCEDTELDPRVDREACRSINLRSAVIVPLFGRGNISGLVEVFYALPRAFDGRDVLTLRRMADLISATICGPVSREPKPPPVQVANAAAPDPPPNPAPVRVAPPGRMIPPAPRVASRPDKVVCDVCGHENPQATTDCEKCDVPLPGLEPAGRTGAVTLGSTLLHPQTDEQTRRITVRLPVHPRMLILIALLLLLVSIWGWQEFKSRRASAARQANTTSAIELPAPEVVSAAAPGSVPEALTPPANLQSPSVPLSLKTGGVTVSKSRAPLTPSTELFSRTTTTLAGSAGKPSPGVLAPGQSTAETQGRVSPSRLIRKVEPVYPESAVASRLQGPVVLRATILRTGRLGKIKVVSGDEMLAGAAVQAVQQWRYQPMELDGKSVETETTITVKFSLPDAR